ncbi:MAG TPA: TIGR03668 family PPOX class F420-dependent oxidoreductase [Streptosporangiaceae bacterium]
MRLTGQEARRRLASARVARLATVSADGLPHLVPITFAVDGDVLYTCVDAKPKSTPDLRRLRNLRINPAVAVLADHYDDDWSTLWWARADGEAAIVEDHAGMMAPIALLASRYPQYRDNVPAGPVIAVGVSRWTGWSAT